MKIIFIFRSINDLKKFLNKISSSQVNNDLALKKAKELVTKLTEPMFLCDLKINI